MIESRIPLAVCKLPGLTSNAKVIYGYLRTCSAMRVHRNDSPEFILTNELIATNVGIAPHTVARAMTQLREYKLITTHGKAHRVIKLNPVPLEPRPTTARAVNSGDTLERDPDSSPPSTTVDDQIRMTRDFIAKQAAAAAKPNQEN